MRKLSMCIKGKDKMSMCLCIIFWLLVLITTIDVYKTCSIKIWMGYVGMCFICFSDWIIAHILAKYEEEKEEEV